MRVMLDTNIFFSTLSFPGVSGTLLKRLLDADAVILTTDYILAELHQSIQDKFEPQYAEQILNLMSTVVTSGKIEVMGAESYIRNLPEAMGTINREDAPILAAAMLSDVTHFVTGDRDFLDNEGVQHKLSSKMVRATELLRMLESNRNTI